MENLSVIVLANASCFPGIIFTSTEEEDSSRIKSHARKGLHDPPNNFPIKYLHSTSVHSGVWHVCECICVCACTHMHGLHVRTHASVHSGVYGVVFACEHACICLCMCAFMCVCIHFCAFTCMCIHVSR